MPSAANLSRNALRSMVNIARMLSLVYASRAGMAQIRRAAVDEQRGFLPLASRRFDHIRCSLAVDFLALEIEKATRAQARRLIRRCLLERIVLIY